MAYTKHEWAANLLQEQHFQDAIAELRKIQLSRFENSTEYDIEERQYAYYKLSALNDFLSHLEGLASQKKIDEKRWKII